MSNSKPVLNPREDMVRDLWITKDLGFRRIAVHQVTLQPGARSSFPHAESAEEEFVFVVKGTADLWYDGHIFTLNENAAIGFPAGSGHAHSFLNNSNSPVELLVVGERTKNENRCAFPINRDYEASCGIPWPEAPSHPLGPHDGRPGPVAPEARRSGLPPGAAYADKLKRGPAFHYPSDNETFGHGARLTDIIGLKKLGIWFEELPPGTRSSWPHAHTHEEEFAFVLGGLPLVWRDGVVNRLEPKQSVGFKPNTGEAHCLINDADTNSGASVFYLSIGETEDFKDEKIFYPLHPLRNKECLRKGFGWENFSSRLIDPYDFKLGPRPTAHICLREPRDANEVLEIFKRSPTYFRRVDGCEPNLKIVEHALVDGPAKRGDDYVKEFLCIDFDNRAIGVVDLHANHPEPSVSYLGLLLIDETQFGRGRGRLIYNHLEQYLKRAFATQKIRLGVSSLNDVTGFWEKMGFAPNGRTYPWTGESVTSEVTEFDKVLSPSV